MELLKKISCENCGGELIFEPSTQLSSCNFCGSEFNIANSEDAEIKLPEKILPFKTEALDFEIAALKWLSEGDLTPDNILEGALFSAQVGVYLPMWMYEGRFDGAWSASSGYDRVEEYIGKSLDGKKLETKTRTVTDWRPSNGNCKGDFVFLASANYDKSMPLSVRSFAHATAIKPSDFNVYDSRYTQGFSMMEMQFDKDTCWENNGKIQADRFVEISSIKRIPGDRHKDFFVDAVYDINTATSCFVPFWLRNYKYKDSEFYLYMDGTDTNRIEGVRPEDEGRKNELKEIDTKRNWGCGITAVLLIIGSNLALNVSEGFSGVVVFIGIIIGIIIVVNAKNRKEKIVSDSKELREKKLNARLKALSSGKNTVSTREAPALKSSSDETPSF